MKLEVLAKKIGYVGMFVAVSTFVAMMIVKGVGGKAAASYDWASWTIQAFIYGVTIIVVAIPEVSVCLTDSHYGCRLTSQSFFPTSISFFLPQYIANFIISLYTRSSCRAFRLL